MKKSFNKPTKILLSVLLVIFAICSTKILTDIFYQSVDPSTISYLQQFVLIFQVVSGLYLITGAIVAVWQYCISVKSAAIKNEREKIEKAIELAGYYKDNILMHNASVRYVYREIGALDIINKINRDKMDHFDVDELKSNLTELEQARLLNLFQGEDFIRVVQEANYIYNLGNTDIDMPSFCTPEDNETLEKGQKLRLTKIANSYMKNQVTMLMNNLEYFAMFFTHNIADDTVVYQSLHQTYFMIVEELYFNISTHNSVPENKYFTNVIALYKKWKRQATALKENNEKIRKQTETKLRNNYVKGAVPENI